MAMRAVHNDNGLTRSHSKDGVPIHAGLPYALLPGAIDDDAPESIAPKPARKVVQVACGGDLHALCDDGTIWLLKATGWNPTPPIPQPGEKR
jgi:hypothetical protein